MAGSFQEFAIGYVKKLQLGLSQLPIEEMERVARAISFTPGTVWLIGNGGSASLADHMATDLRLAGVRAISLTSVAEITTIANDQEFEGVFSHQLRQLARKGDILIAISGSGNSPNIIQACTAGKRLGLTVVGMSGFLGGRMPVDHLLHFISKEMGVAQDLEQIGLHILCYWLMEGVRDEIS